MVLTGSARGRESVHDGFKLYSKAAGPGEAEVGMVEAHPSQQGHVTIYAIEIEKLVVRRVSPTGKTLHMAKLPSSSSPLVRRLRLGTLEESNRA